MSRAGLVPSWRWQNAAGLADLTAEHVRIAACGVNAHLKACCLVAGMAVGADSTGGMDVLRHGTMGVLVGGVRAPSTLGSFCACSPGGTCFSCRRCTGSFLAGLSLRAPLLPGPDVLAFLDMDPEQERVYEHAKQGGAPALQQGLSR